ncbi:MULTISPECIES: UvrD-helicase domain-containing protein [Brevibacillus]|uniref:UvrD-helicase domain-containing protein n=1 Tax=Brevibacillus TaxID=55080 RepID=UPI000D0F3A0C|nr:MULTISPECIES: ATP-dependent helicase [Brevibacillus]MED1947184.1 UvrD-helicase domain-containing protein [Brevibacillus formosus]MED1997549.1 UvrD-helicase domain-containing protein [Brevibacillus formosus]MED2083406.1 UvrD-helicase domain-containing protein [Brevibacillus formosus]PSK17063.1 ATP-dependent DNA helicase [Brevibacillus sp. NRRL NRS-603]
MNYALLDNKPILLLPQNYNRISFWRMAARQDKVRCPACASALRLHAGISFEPHFFHPEGAECPLLTENGPAPLDSLQAINETAATAFQAVLAMAEKEHSDDNAKEPLAFSTKEQSEASIDADETNTATIGSFRLPKKRTIGTSTTPSPPAPKPPVFRKRLMPKKTISHMAEQMRDQSLHPGQQQAVHATEGPFLILAGAGSGKTRVMTARTTHLISELGVKPNQIMVVTFTTKAADEIRQRIARQLPAGQARELIAGTFHSIFYRMLLHHQPERWDQQRLLKKDWQKWRLMRETGALLGHDDLATLKETEITEALGIVSRWKNEYILPHEVAYREATSDAEKRAIQLYPLYEATKKKHQWFDFDDMLIGCYEMLRDDPGLLRRYQERITYVMVDEFQDINRIQYETVKLLAAPQNNLCVIGDDDQSIYGFRGSDPQYILGFTKDFPQASTFTLEVNYRSHSSIVSLGYSLIGHNRERWAKECQSFHREEGDTYLFEPEDEEEQASRIVDEIIHRREQGAILGECAILYRTNESARPILERLSEAGIPFHYTQEEDSFYQRQTVRWTLNYLRLALNPDDTDALKEILSTLYISAEMWNVLRSQAIIEDKPILHVLPHLTQLKPYQRKHMQQINEILTACKDVPPAQALELIYEDGKLRDYLKKRAKDREDGRERWSDELQQILAASKRHATISDFLAYIDQMARQEKEWRTMRPLPDEAVHVLSIHRAKGLEYDHVFLPDLVEGALPHEYTLDELRKGGSGALEEERRLLYVAITRARHSLCIGIPRERFGRKTRTSRFIAEMGR